MNETAQDTEEWRNIPGFSNNYQVSNYGRVRSRIEPGSHKVTDTWRILNPVTEQGYKRIYVGRAGRLLTSVHRLVALAFLPNPDNLPVINHKNEDPSDNRACNLEWCTVKYNSNYGTCKLRASRALLNNPGVSKNVWQFTLDGILIKCYPSVNEASRQTGISVYHIRRHASGVSKSASDYLWSYTSTPPKKIDRYSLYKPVPVCQYTLDMRFIREYPSQAIAGRECGINPTNIWGCCKGLRRKAGGYIWRVKNEKTSVQDNG